MTDPRVVHMPAEDVPVAGRYDVLVCGGGTSGWPAAVAAARQGASVALIERYGFLGGVPAFSIMPCWHGLSKHGSGMVMEFARRVGEFAQGPDPVRSGNHMEPETVKAVAMEMVLEAGVELHLHTWVSSVSMQGRRVSAIITESKSGRRAFEADCFIDATGDGDAAVKAGAEYRLGDGERVQGVTVRFRIGHIDFARYFDWVSTHREYFKHLTDERLVGLRRKAAEGEAFFMEADFTPLYRQCPDADLPEHTYFNCSSIRRGELSVNSTRLYGIDGTREEDLTRAEVICRRQVYAIWRFLRGHIPGFEQSAVVDVAPQVGVRESRLIVGDYVLSESDLRSFREFGDSVMTTRVSFDIHDPGKYTLETLNGLGDVPYRIFLPRNLDGLILAGRMMSTDHVANSSFRRMESVFQAGQVAGTAASMATQRGRPPRELDVGELQDALKAQGLFTSQAHRRSVSAPAGS